MKPKKFKKISYFFIDHRDPFPGNKPGILYKFNMHSGRSGK